MAVRLADVADALTMGDDCRIYYDRQDDELVWVLGDELSTAEDLPEAADLAEAATYTNSGDVDSLKLALLILEDATDRFVPLPTKFDVDEHSIMVDFTATLPESELRRRLWDGLHRAGAFRRFKDLVHRHDLADAWYRYRDEQFTRIARKWADANNITLVEQSR
ncbi:hypothetical protein H5398_11170 [Tessaracoccus sp. MC1679]|uniref:UPF0158 family protein n=1 Tax=Tessaracoccus sp. MC1679 TaxID=2760313 RepID=UPI0015FED20A|nr:hypothetical protein [Tessaracoccus sp. MC1679]